MALTVTKRSSNVVGNERVLTMDVAGDTSGTVKTGLSYVYYANLSGRGTSDLTCALYKNSNTTTNDNGTGGSVHLDGIANTAEGYTLKVVGR